MVIPYIEDNPREATKNTATPTKNLGKCSVLTIPHGKCLEKSGVLGIEVPHTCLREDIREYSLIRKPRINYF